MSLDTKDISTVNINADTLDGKHDGELTAVKLAEKRGNGYDLNTALNDGGIVSNYGAASYWVNVPVGFSFGSAISFVSDMAHNSIPGMLAWDITHNTANATRFLWWRAKNNLGWGDWKQLAFVDSNVASSQKLQDSQGVYVDRATWQSLVARVAALENK